LVAVVAASCSGTAAKKVPATEGAGEGGEAGATSEALGGRGGSGGASTGGASGSDGIMTSDGGAAADSGAGGSFGEALPGDMAGAAGAPAQDPPIDVGEGCLQPLSAPKLSPTAAGLPADGLTLWLRGDRGVYATDQHRVCAWADQSANKFLFKASSGTRPLWGAASLGAQSGIDFDTTTSLLSITGVLGIPATSGRTFIAVVQSVDTTGRFAAVQQGQSGSPGTYLGMDANTFNTAGSHEGVYICNNSYDAAASTSTAARVHVYTIDTMVPGQPVLTNIDYRVNGAPQMLSRDSGGLGNGNIEDFSGANFTLVAAGAHAIMAEAIIYNRALSIEERGAVETALKTRYGIQ